MSAIPESPDAILSRSATAAALTEAGYPTTAATLATYACRGNNGPPYRLFGRRPQYRWGDVIQWAKARTSKLITSRSELDAA
jgi:hypothetical protein